MSAKETRIERDSMGEMEVPVSAYYGASTMRAVLNFPISSLRFSREFIQALAVIKGSAAATNIELGILDANIGNAITQAATEVSQGKFDNEFVLDIFQTGSGTSTNTNANEVIANRATEILGGDRGARLVHPNDHPYDSDLLEINEKNRLIKFHKKPHKKPQKRQKKDCRNRN